MAEFILPPEGRVIRRRTQPLVFKATLRGARTRTVIDLRDWPGDERMREEIADSLEALTSSTGTWTTKATFISARTVVKQFLHFCDRNGISSLGELTPAHWNDFRLEVQRKGASTTHQHTLANVRMAISRYPQRLRGDLRIHLKQRLPKTNRNPIQPYGADDFARIKEAAKIYLNAEYRRIVFNHALLLRRDESGLTPEQAMRAQALFEVMRTGAPQSKATRDALGIVVACDKSLGVIEGRSLIFPTRDAALAMGTLIACAEGLNPTTISARLVPSAAPGLGVAEDIMSIEDEKRRRHRHPFDAYAIPKASRPLINKIIEMTQPLREHMQDQEITGTDQLILYWTGTTKTGPTVGIPRHRGESPPRWWPENVPNLQFPRLRKDFVVRLDRGPNAHSRATWASQYVAASEEERERLHLVAESGLWSVITNAEQHLKMRFERRAASTNTDTALAGCSDWLHHPETGDPCGDDFLLCLQCENAFATVRHLPRLMALREALEALASSDGPDWTDFRAMAYGCLVALLDNRSLISEDEIRQAQRKVTDADRRIVTLMLSGRLT